MSEKWFKVSMIAMLVGFVVSMAAIEVYDRGWKDGFHQRSAIYESVYGAKP